MRRFWTEQEVATLRRLYRQVPTADVAARLNRTVKAVYQHAEKLELMERRRFTFDDVARIVTRRHPQGWSDSDIAAEAKCSREWVTEVRGRLQLKSHGQTERWKDKIRAATDRQLKKAGLKNLAELRSKVFHDRAKAAGWPADLRLRHVDILNLLWERGPQTRREICEGIGMRWIDCRRSLKSSDPEGSYLAHLAKRGLVVRLIRAKQVVGHGRGRTCDLYMLPFTIERGEVA